jgi:hypothetical protein
MKGLLKNPELIRHIVGYRILSLTTLEYKDTDNIHLQRYLAMLHKDVQCENPKR